MQKRRPRSDALATRSRLLTAAGEVFAERGFHSATIKEITDRADASIASVNYHFTGKDELYASVLKRIETDARQIIPPPSAEGTAPREELRRCICHIVRFLLGRGQPVWERVLLARELAQPSPALDPLIESIGRPLHERIAILVGQITGLSPTSDAAAMITCSIVAQCLFHMEHRELLHRLHPQLADPPTVERIAEHISEFSLAALGG